MEDKTTPVELLLERAQAYTKTSIKLFKFKATEKIAELVSNLASGFVIMTVLALFFVNLNIGIALLIGDWLGRLWMGFILLSVFYCLIGLIVYLFRDKWIKRPINNLIIRQLIDDEPFNDNDLSD